MLIAEVGLNKTVHEKIFVGRPIFIDFDTLRAKLEELRFITEGGNKKEMILKLKELVPTYKKANYDNEITAESNYYYYSILTPALVVADALIGNLPHLDKTIELKP